MDFTNILIQYKQERTKIKKTPLNVSLVEERLKRLDSAISANSQFYEFLNRSEKVDFLLYILERFMQNSPQFNLNEQNQN